VIQGGRPLLGWIAAHGLEEAAHVIGRLAHLSPKFSRPHTKGREVRGQEVPGFFRELAVGIGLRREQPEEFGKFSFDLREVLFDRLRRNAPFLEITGQVVEVVLTAGGSTMPQTPHVEKHFTTSEAVRDIVIGMSDGLTVPFALAAGLSGAVEATAIIITAGLAEVAAGAIAMGLGGYLAARTDAEHFTSERAREERETKEMPETEAAEVADVFRSYGLNDDTVATVVNAIRADKRRWVDFMMRFELGLEEPDPRRARTSALTIALSYIAGGLVPLAPYFFRSVHCVPAAAAVS
jgi:VIT1/CCC1 family predicted Fe2+/Mn2+ transporter